MNCQLNNFFYKSKKHYIVICESYYEKICNSHKFIKKLLMSFIFYLFFNASLLKLINRSNVHITAIGFINDINLLTYDKSTKTNCAALKKMHNIYVQ